MIRVANVRTVFRHLYSSKIWKKNGNSCINYNYFVQREKICKENKY